MSALTLAVVCILLMIGNAIGGAIVIGFVLWRIDLYLRAKQ